MIKSRLINFSIFLFVIILTLSLVMPVYANEQLITLTLAEFSGPISLAGRGVTILQEEIAKKTNGKVELKIYWAGSLLKGKEVLRGVEDGVVDMGAINANYYPNQMPVGGVFNVLPAGPFGYEAQRTYYKNIMKQVPEMEAEYLEHNQLPLFLLTLQNIAICSTKPLVSLEDLKNKKIRSSSRWILNMFRDLGATPVSVPWGDLYMALQTGTIDAAMTNFDSLHDAKLDEVAQNLLLFENFPAKPAIVYTVNLDVWNNLSEDIQGQIMQATEATALSFSKLYDAEWEKCIKEAKEMGCVVNFISKADWEKWKNLPAIDENQVQWVKEMEDQGSKNAEEILEKIKNISE